MNIEEVKKLKRNVERVYSTSEDVAIDRVVIDKISHKYSSTKIPVYRFFIDGKVIKKNNGFKVAYRCITCNRLNDVALNNITRKMNRGMVFCASCRNLDEDKRRRQRETLFNTLSNPDERRQVSVPMKDRLLQDETAFDDMDEEFKEHYFRRHMDRQEFEYIRSKIVCVGNNVDISELEYYPCVSVSNQVRFNPHLYDPKEDALVKFHDICVKCDSCQTNFRKKNLFTLKNRIKALCRDCNLTNDVFKIRTHHNCRGEKVLYQSKFELKFIKECNALGVYIQNGPKIPYTFLGKKREYRVDFSIPKLHMLVEIKDNHVWHRDQVDSGKWESKMDGIREYTSKTDETFETLFPKNLQRKMKYICHKYNTF